MASVDLTDIYKSFGSVQVVDDVSLDIADGEFVALVGPSGCGKTTLLRMIAGLEDVTGGEIRIDDQVVNDVPPKNRDIAMVFQSYALYPHMTVAENMGFALRLKGVTKDEIAQRVRAAAGILNLDGLLGRYPRALSGGQRQRVAMGRAIVRDPKVFLFDEPLSNLDAKLRVQMRSEIRALHQRLGTTSIYVTHDQIEAMTMADRIVLLNGGKVEQVGPPLELFDKPANLFVASFIGSPAMNLMAGRIDNGYFVTNCGIRVPVPDSAQYQPSRDGVIAGFRPDQITLGDHGIQVELISIEPTGSETHLTARNGAETFRMVFPKRVAYRPGEFVSLMPDIRSLHLFDAISGARL